MKNFKHLAGYLPFILLFLNSTFLFSQGRGLLPPPSFINYQAVARNSAGNVLINQNVSVRFNIHDGSAGGPITYQENQSLTTNQFGLLLDREQRQLVHSRQFLGREAQNLYKLNWTQQEVVPMSIWELHNLFPYRMHYFQMKL